MYAMGLAMRLGSARFYDDHHYTALRLRLSLALRLSVIPHDLR